MNEVAEEVVQLDLSEEQENAFNEIVDWYFDNGKYAEKFPWAFTLKGSAGTGKSLLTVLTCIKLNQEHGLRIALTAPTHKAVAVMEQKFYKEAKKFGFDPDKAGKTEVSELQEMFGSTGEAFSFSTIHSLLKLKVVEQDNGEVKLEKIKYADGENVADFDLIVVDEASMVSKDLTKHIFEGRCNLKVLFVGDIAQLPPPDDSVPSPVFSEQVPSVQLTEVHRAAKENPVIRACIKVRENWKHDIRTSLEDIQSVMKPGDERFMSMGGNPVQIALSAMEHGLECRILSYSNRTVQAMNKAIHEHFHGNETPFNKGEAVMFNQEYSTPKDDLLKRKSRRIVNNSEGVVTKCEKIEHKGRVCWKVGVIVNCVESDVYVADDPVQLGVDVSTKFAKANALKRAGDSSYKDVVGEAWALKKAFADLRHTNAMTVHKSQGSGFGATIVDWVELDGVKDTDLRNQLIYVAMSRTIDYLVIAY